MTFVEKMLRKSHITATKATISFFDVFSGGQAQ